MSKSNNDLLKQIMKNSIHQKNIIVMKVFFVESKINLILRKHFKEKRETLNRFESL